jgi:uncharacterized flavoprotein (TIGR03862 family)
MAAEVLSAAGVAVDLFDAMPSVGRKFLLAGKGGLNLTHAEPDDRFVSRYGTRQAQLADLVRDFGPQQVREWAKSLGVDTFVGTSGHVFPTDMKAAPLLRAWLARLRHPQSGQSVRFHMRHRWNGSVKRSEDGALTLCFDTQQGPVYARAQAVLLALGGGSWARLGSDGAWVPWLQARGVDVAPLRPANCGFDVASPRAAAVGWSAHFASRHAGEPFKSVAISVRAPDGTSWQRRGEFVATATGVEGSLIYAASSVLRDDIERHDHATFWLDLLPDLTLERVLAEVSHPRGSRSLSSHLKSRLHLHGIKAAILFEILSKEDLAHVPTLAAAIKALPIRVLATRPIDEAISSAGGVRFEGLDRELMLSAQPGLFCAGEMLDWEAPTGGYLLTACFASGARAAHGVLRHLGVPSSAGAGR